MLQRCCYQGEFGSFGSNLLKLRVKLLTLAVVVCICLVLIPATLLHCEALRESDAEAAAVQFFEQQSSSGKLVLLLIRFSMVNVWRQ
jgi:hypothetical protein